MPFINVEVDESTKRAAREACGRAGMQLKAWVERAILRAAAAERTQDIPVPDLVEGE